MYDSTYFLYLCITILYDVEIQGWEDYVWVECCGKKHLWEYQTL